MPGKPCPADRNEVGRPELAAGITLETDVVVEDKLVAEDAAEPGSAG